jgi:hypothetical protein
MIPQQIDSICWETISILFHMISFTRFMTIIETEYCYLCTQLMMWILFEFIIEYRFQFMIHSQMIIGCQLNAISEKI